MMGLNDMATQRKSGTYRVKWYVEKPVSLWERSPLILDGGDAIRLFKEKLDMHSQVMLIEEKVLAHFFVSSAG